MLMISKRFSLWIICLLKIWNDKVVPKLRKIMNFGTTLLIALTEEKQCYLSKICGKMPMNQTDKYISYLEAEIQYLKKLLDDNGISYDYEAHLRALQSDVGDIIWYGSMTLLSNEKDDDSLMRINNPAVAEELLEFAISES